MKIERVDDKTIKCYLSIEEMEEYEVDYRDFLARSDRAQRLMQEIIEQAREEVGYEPPKMAFEMQIMMVPEQGMVLTFSEKEPDMDSEKMAGFLQNIRALLEHLKEYRDSLAQAVPGIAAANTSGMSGIEALGIERPGGGNPAVTPGEDARVHEAVFCFDTVSDVMQYADMFPARQRIGSKLYKMDDKFFLLLTQGGAAYDRFSRACVQALEFSELYRAGTGCEDVLTEHGEVLVAEKALNRLRTPR